MAAARAGVLKFQGEDIFLIMLIREGGAVRVPPLQGCGDNLASSQYQEYLRYLWPLVNYFWGYNFFLASVLVLLCTTGRDCVFIFKKKK